MTKKNIILPKSQLKIKTENLISPSFRKKLQEISTWLETVKMNTREEFDTLINPHFQAGKYTRDDNYHYVYCSQDNYCLRTDRFSLSVFDTNKIKTQGKVWEEKNWGLFTDKQKIIISDLILTKLLDQNLIKQAKYLLGD